ncbi:hypothetical protein [Longimicrobium sp.]|uniref:hypothetical protein n=1 Tax=Longimicrobium sp. TaxID=2029185 RepID=UPI002E3696B2|nr:hypothetical protein [Longimicrobium sp.]HEX6041111.1 hypothetical protein [Longimicrobium sp.]
MQFQQTAVPQLYAPQGAGASGPALYLLLPADTSAPPATLGLAQSWTAYPGGAYLFLPQPVAAGGEQAFATAAWSFLADPSLKAPRFAWLAGSVPVSGALSGPSAAVYQPSGGTWATSRSTTFGFRNLSLFLAGGAAVSVDDGAGVFTFGAAGSPPATLIAGWGGTPLPAVAGGPLTLPATGPLAGCLCFPATLAQTGGVPDVDTLDVGLRFFYGEPAGGSAQAFFLDSLRFPLLATETSSLALYAAMDPLAPLSSARTFLAFSPGDAGLPGPAAAPVPSYLRSTLGQALALQPRTGSGAPTAFARLAFAERPVASPPGPAEPLYLVPQGDFAVTGGASVLCGLSGVEFVALGGDGDLLSFYPGQPAYAAGFYPGLAPGSVNLVPSTPPTTSFAAVSAPSGTLDYYAQPDQSVLFNYAATQPSGVTTLPSLAAQQVLAATLPWPPTPSEAFPLLPYAGASGALAAYAQMESQVISPLRRGVLSGTTTQVQLRTRALTVDPAPASKYSTTPQGLLATYTPGAPVWDEVVLGQMAATGAQLLLNGVQGDLLSAFQSNKLFLVVTNPASMQGVLLQDSSTVQVGADADELWNFDLDPASWARFGTIFIIKFYNQGIRDLTGQPGAWAFPSTFNADPAQTAQALAGIISSADPNDADFAAFVNAVTNPAWNGILALNVRAPLDELPAQLAGLAAGIDPAQFYAHHVGISASRVNVPATPGDLSITDSSIFGLINYQAPGPLRTTGAPYQFQVERLKVLFLNSAVAGFGSIIDLQVNQLFGESAALRGTPDNIVQMYGVYQKHESNGHTQESYTFQTPTGAPSVFDLTSAVLNTVQLSGGQFITVSPQQPSYALAANGAVRAGGTTTLTTAQPHGLAAGDSVRVEFVADDSFNGVFAAASVPSATTLTYGQAGAPDATSTGGSVAATFIQSQFVFWGLADFRALAGFDVFSFGRTAAGGAPAGLSFGNLVIAMDFDSEQTPITPAFTFDAGALSLDPAGSTARPDSFFSHFPLTVSALTQGRAGTTPADGGFMGVQSPLTQSALQSPWFSLNFNLDLGSPGALAAQSGFVATLAAAWSPGGTASNPSVYVGLKLPGSSGSKKAIQVEGIFDITFKSLAIVGDPASNTFILILYGIGFKFLSFTFPPVGQVNFVLFGNPGQAGAGTTLGWYAAYAKPVQQKAAGTNPNGGILPPANGGGGTGGTAPALPAAGAVEG